MEIFDILESHWKQKLPFVAYNRPGAQLLRILFQDNRKTHYVRDYRESGFVFAPFDPACPAYLLMPDRSHSLPCPAINSDIKTDSYNFRAPDGGKRHFLNLVGNAKEGIVAGLFQKVVVSRRTRIATDVSPIRAFRVMLARYPAAFCYLWYHPATGVWLGASPELLLSIRQGQFKTMSLAGTMEYGGIKDPEWGGKELEEQLFVTEFIREALKNKVSSLRETGPESVRAGRLLHLQSELKGEIDQACSLEAILKALHPTPAVCGLPMLPAFEFIKEQEDYDRSFYSGFLGTLNLPEEEGEAGFYVNLRCMTINAGEATLFVGAGITAASSSESEWQETVDKCSTMYEVLHNSSQ